MNKNRFILIMVGVFISIEFLLSIVALLSSIYLREKFRRIGWAFVTEKDAAKFIAALPLGVLAYVARTGRDLVLPKGEPLPDHIEEWPSSASILDFVIIGLAWAFFNLIITSVAVFFPNHVHSGILFIVVIWSCLLCSYQGMNFYSNEIKSKKNFKKPKPSAPPAT